jgi:hypothetical protein
VRKVGIGLALVGIAVFALFSQRSEIFLGSSFDFSTARFWNAIAPSQASAEDDTVYLYGLVNVSHEHGRHYWGVRYLATYFIRPIPRQLWPTKYSDLGLGWMVDQEDVAGITDEEWRSSVGWLPVRGSACGFAADLYLEFSTLGLLFCPFLGYFFAWLWRRAAVSGGYWTILYIQSAALTIYVPTQSISAVFHRFLFTSLLTFVMWKLIIGSRLGLRSTGTPAHEKHIRAALQNISLPQSYRSKVQK